MIISIQPVERPDPKSLSTFTLVVRTQELDALTKELASGLLVLVLAVFST